MKKTTKFLTVAALLATGFSGTAMADEGFSIGADVVSSYVWRGTEQGDSFAVQPSLTYTFAGSGVEVGAWGSYAVAENDGSRHKEIDLYASVPVGPLTLTATDYFTAADGNKSFDFTDDGQNVVEISASYAIDDLSLLAGVNVAGLDTNNAVYCEAGYQFYDKDGYTASGFVGAGNEVYTTDADFNVVNTGISVSKDRYTASYVYNPDSEMSHLVFMASF